MSNKTELENITQVKHLINNTIEQVKKAITVNKDIAKNNTHYENSGALDVTDTRLFDASYSLEMALKAINELQKEAMQRTGITCQADIDRILMGWASE